MLLFAYILQENVFIYLLHHLYTFKLFQEKFTIMNDAFRVDSRQKLNLTHQNK